MLKYIGKRLIYLVLTLLIIVTVTFFLMKQLPGTPFDTERFNNLSPEQQEQMLEKYGLNDPVPVQYVKYLGNLIRGDLGTSFLYTGRPVSDVIFSRLGPSLLIGIQAVLLGLLVGLTLGIIAAWKHNSGIDYFTMVIAVLGVSVPNFVVAALLQYFVGLKWGILPVAFWTSWACSVLPSIALSFSATAMFARFIRTEMLDVLEQDYITTARVNLLTGSLAVESIYSVPGIGSLFVDCIKNNDYSTIMGITIFYSAFYIFVILVVDILYCVIDPRIRIQGTKEG